MFGGRIQLQQVIINLIINAIEAIADRGDALAGLVRSTEKAGIKPLGGSK